MNWVIGKATTLNVPPTICALCGNSAKLCRSHILPDLAYSSVLDYTKHPRMVVVRDVQSGRISDTTHQTGFWERLLCEKCEGRFSKYEQYAAENLLNVALPPPTGTGMVILQSLNYPLLKLFLLSLLWRVGVAKGQFFRCVNLGSHEERLRRMLDNEDPGEPDEYGCLITPFLAEPEIDVSHLLSQPFSTRTEGHNGVLLSFRGFAFNFFISRHALRPGVAGSFLNRNGELKMLRSRIGDFQPLRSLWNQSVAAVRREVGALQQSAPSNPNP